MGDAYEEQIDGLNREVAEWASRYRQAAAEVDRLRATVSRLAEWAHTFGAELKPKGADTYGEGVRDSKERVSRILSGLSGSVLPEEK